MKKILYILIPLLALSGCRKHDDTTSTSMQVTIVPSIVSTLSKATTSTTTSGGEFEVGDQVGVYLSVGGTLKSSNVCYTNNDEGVFAPAAPLYYSSYEKHDIIGYYPYNSTATSPTLAFTVQADQGLTTKSYTQSDLLYALVKDQQPQQKTDEAVPMAFDHKLTSVVVRIKNGDGAAFITPPVVSIINTNMTADLTLADGTLAAKANTKGTIKMVRDMAYEDIARPNEYFYRAIAVPQTLGADKLFQVTSGGGAYDAPAPTGVTSLEAGKEQAFDLTITGIGLVISGGEIVDWGANSAIGGNLGGTGVDPSKMFFSVINDTKDEAKKVTRAVLSIDNKSYTSTSVAFSPTGDAGSGTGTLSIVYDQKSNWGSMLYDVTLYDDKDLVIKEIKGLNYQITGDPSSASYNTIIGIFDFAWEPTSVVMSPANCFVMTPGGAIEFDAKVAGNGSIFKGFVNASDAEVATLQANLKNNINSVKILWQTRQGHSNNGEVPLVLSSVKYADGKATVRARAGGQGGNAVVAAYAADGTTILWSWHIWVSPVPMTSFMSHNYGDAFKAANGDNNSIMDRNLGALSASPDVSMQLTGGMLYQWGRKDPFTGSADGTSTAYIQVYDKDGNAIAGTLGGFQINVTSVSLTDAVRVPMTHYYNHSNNDWCSADEKKRWTSYSLTTATLDIDNKGDKTVFDPCPAGYRVPTGSSNSAQGTWGDFGYTPIPGPNPYWKGSGTIAGSLFTKGAQSWYPAYGLRINSRGALGNVATHGYCWSASPCDNAGNSWCLGFNSSYVSPAGTANRSYGFPVRCVQE